MFYRLFQFLFLVEFCINNSIEWDFLFNIDDNDKLLCYSCKGNECEQVIDTDQNKVLCNRKTQLCWAGFIDQEPYRTCASRFCTPSDFSLDSDIRIETCCRSNFCNSLPLSWQILSKAYMNVSSSSHTDNSTTMKTNNTITKENTVESVDYFIGEIIDEKPLTGIIKDAYSNEEEDEERIRLNNFQLNTNNLNSSDTHGPRISYNNGVASISSIVLFLMPLLFVLLF
ncbi:unnamed protein product [Adineta steineri]|uniref:Uncharacterized protein n=1 Tax=Adineta steineri TaxID=433720 RepID=A0A818IRU7_9BILA|nr:unnamed protein product [Adineta steineri]CAF0878559.1 unnamed protein product [Adineta steineri]CAF3527471.1 unnamed protein product [Adineta steineri]CAF3596179.1 unnamed protein product [Adineta steineri]